MRHADPTTTLRYYVKVIPENQRKAVADFERSVMKERGRAAFEGGTESLIDERLMKGFSG